MARTKKEKGGYDVANGNGNLEVMNEDRLQVKLKEAIATIEKRLEDLMVDVDYVYQAPPNFKYNELDGNTVNIQTTESTAFNMTYLMKALSKMKRVKQDYEILVGDMEFSSFPVCTWTGVSVDKWISDLTVIIRRMNNAQKIAQLKDKLKELRGFLSQKEKLVDLLKEFRELLK